MQLNQFFVFVLLESKLQIGSWPCEGTFDYEGIGNASCFYYLFMEISKGILLVSRDLQTFLFSFLDHHGIGLPDANFDSYFSWIIILKDLIIIFELDGESDFSTELELYEGGVLGIVNFVHGVKTFIVSS